MYTHHATFSQNKRQESVLFIVGPTATGKTELAIALTKRFPVHLISMDSAMVYRGLDIGSAKPKPELLARYPHALVDILEPWQTYSVAAFCADVEREVRQAQQAAKLPIVVGGTMMYYHALMTGLANMPAVDANLLFELQTQAKQIGWPALHTKLQAIDPIFAANVAPTDPQRIQRGLAVYMSTGKPLSQWWQESRSNHSAFYERYRCESLALTVEPRQHLHARIATRVQCMLAQGLEKEVAYLYKQQALSVDLPAMRAVGYRQVRQYLCGEISQEALPDKIVAATRQLAKRQLTWLRRYDHIHWFDAARSDLTMAVCDWLVEKKLLH